MSATDLDIDKDDFTDASTTFPQKFKLSSTFLFGNKPIRHLGEKNRLVNSFCNTKDDIFRSLWHSLGEYLWCK